jgi:hypothetical protein
MSRKKMERPVLGRGLENTGQISLINNISGRRRRRRRETLDTESPNKNTKDSVELRNKK